MRKDIKKVLLRVARFYDNRKVGDVGTLGFRRSTDLTTLVKCIEYLVDQGLLVPDISLFFDMGCGDGRVNLLLSYIVKISVGVELDEWTLDDYWPLQKELTSKLTAEHLPLPPKKIFLFHGDTLDAGLHKAVNESTGLALKDFDIFYTYLIMQEEFSKLIADKAKQGALFLVYGLDRVLPRFNGLKLLTTGRSLEGILAIYRKE